MKVFYRLCDVKSPLSAPPPAWAGDQFLINSICLKSFVRAYRDVDPNVTFICDFCPPQYNDLLSDIVPFEYDVINTESGIDKTCQLQYTLASQTNDGIILFQECDYLYGRNAIPLLNATEELGLVSPYDNRNFYIDKALHSEDCKIRLIGDATFRSVERDTMTFMVRSDVFQKHYKTFEKYGYLDGDVWYDLKRDGQTLWAAVPSFATHMVRDYMAPNVPWEDIWKTLI